MSAPNSTTRLRPYSRMVAGYPTLVYAIFAVLILATGGFGYGFFYQLNENSKLKDVKWLYRYERLWWEDK